MVHISNVTKLREQRIKSTKFEQRVNNKNNGALTT